MSQNGTSGESGETSVLNFRDGTFTTKSRLIGHAVTVARHSLRPTRTACKPRILRASDGDFGAGHRCWDDHVQRDKERLTFAIPL